MGSGGVCRGCDARRQAEARVTRRGAAVEIRIGKSVLKWPEPTLGHFRSGLNGFRALDGRGDAVRGLLLVRQTADFTD